MDTTPSKFEWRCVKQPHYYLIVLRCGVLELGETIERQIWTHSIDRCLLLRRVAHRLENSMRNVIAATQRPEPHHPRGEIVAIGGQR